MNISTSYFPFVQLHAVFHQDRQVLQFATIDNMSQQLPCTDLELTMGLVLVLHSNIVFELTLGRRVAKVLSSLMSDL